MIHSRLNKSFKMFINQDEHFTKGEQDHILSSFVHKKNYQVFYLSIFLLMWSIIGAIIESVLLGGATIVSIINSPNISYFIPAILFLIFNIIAKVLFALLYVRRYITTLQALSSGVPYIGAALVLGFLLKNNKLFLKGLLHYIKYLRRHSLAFIYNLF